MPNELKGRWIQRERQYQLTAQKRNDAQFRHNDNQRTAKYFERESQIAKHYNSWNFKDYTERLRKSEKAETLAIRRKKLKSLFDKEEIIYDREIEQKKRKIKKEQVEPSLEDLRKKLLEKRAEENLYLPRSYRKYQRCLPRSADSLSTRSNNILPFASYVSDKGINMSTHSGESNASSNIQIPNDESKRYDFDRSPNCQQSVSPINPRYLQRYAHQSLNNTNIMTNSVNKYSSLHQEKSSNLLNHPDHDEDLHLQHDHPISDTNNLIDIDKNGTNQELNNRSPKSDRESLKSSSSRFINKNPEDRMILYLTDNELKDQLDALGKREMCACTKRNWTEALRLRHMKNQIELIRESKHYSLESTEVDNDTVDFEMKNIKKRTEDIAHRELKCSDSRIYSEEAKEIWENWTREDKEYMVKDAHLQREAVMKELETEWQDLAIQEKEKISQAYKKVTSASALQNELQLTADLAKRADLRSFNGYRNPYSKF